MESHIIIITPLSDSKTLDDVGGFSHVFGAVAAGHVPCPGDRCRWWRSSPSHPGAFQHGDATWWELAGTWDVPSSNFTQKWNISIYSGFSHEKWWFSTVMWVITRGYGFGSPVWNDGFGIMGIMGIMALLRMFIQRLAESLLFLWLGGGWRRLEMSLPWWCHLRKSWILQVQWE